MLHELSAWDPRPGVRLAPLFHLGGRRSTLPPGAPVVQTFRSLVQVNFYPRPR